MFEWPSVGTTFWLAVAAMCIVPSIVWYLRQVKQDEHVATLKRDMIARGMSAEDIERVLKATDEPDDD
jgi:hypothetical protein